MKNQSFRLDPLLKFWTYTKRFFFLFSILTVNLYLLTLNSDMNFNVILFNQKMNFELSSLLMIISLLSIIAFIKLLHKQRTKPGHDYFIWKLAQLKLGCKRAWYDNEFLYIEFSKDIELHELRYFIGNMNILSDRYKYEVASVEEEVNVIIIKPIKIQLNNVIEFKKKARYNL